MALFLAHPVERGIILKDRLPSELNNFSFQHKEPVNNIDMVNKAYVDICMKKVYHNLERKFQTIPGCSTMFSNHVLYDAIEVNISEFKKRVDCN